MVLLLCHIALAGLPSAPASLPEGVEAALTKAVGQLATASPEDWVSAHAMEAQSGELLAALKAVKPRAEACLVDGALDIQGIVLDDITPSGTTTLGCGEAGPITIVWRMQATKLRILSLSVNEPAAGRSQP